MAEISLSSVRIFADGLDHPECVALGPDGRIYAGGEAGQIYEISTGGEVKTIANTGGFILGLCLDAESNIYACDLKKHVVYRITPEGIVSVYSDGIPSRKMITPNFPVFDFSGNLFVSDSGNWHQANGCIYKIRPGGHTEIASSEFAEFPNGLALSPCGKVLYVALSNIPGVASGEILPDGRLGTPKIVTELSRAVPDGLACDREGNLLIACYTPDVIYRLSKSGDLTTLIEDWESTTISSPTNVAFVGDELKSLLIASLSRWHLASVDVGVAGSPLNYPSMTNNTI